MPIDYSKWDHIEISDDSDIEVHPNVDKASFIRWKQRDIHEKRQQRNVEIKSILMQLTMYAKLNERVDFLLARMSDEEIAHTDKAMALLDSHFDPTEKFDYETLKKERGSTLRKGLQDLSFVPEEYENISCYNEMIEDLFIQIKEDYPQDKENGKAIKGYLNDHRRKIDEVLSKQSSQLDNLLYQKSMLITEDDIHTGFDRSFLNKTQQDEDENVKISQQITSQQAQKTKAKQEITESQFIKNSTTKKIKKNRKVDSETEPEPEPETETEISKSDKEDLENLELLDATRELGNLPFEDLDSTAVFLVKHTSICNEEQKDALLMSAFDFQLAGNSMRAKQVIHQALLLQYVNQLAGPRASVDQKIRAIKLFCARVKESGPARQGFMADVENTFNHIQKRCEIIAHETSDAGEEEAQIQLKSLDDGHEILVNIPKPDTHEFEIFTNHIPVEMQEAVKSGSLDEVNKVFAKMQIADAEHVLELFDKCKVISINAYLEDENEFKELQSQYNEAIEEESRNATAKHEKSDVDISDVVD